MNDSYEKQFHAHFQVRLEICATYVLVYHVLKSNMFQQFTLSSHARFYKQH